MSRRPSVGDNTPPLKVEDALTYLDQVKNQFADRLGFYFYQICTNLINTNKLIEVKFQQSSKILHISHC